MHFDVRLGVSAATGKVLYYNVSDYAFYVSPTQENFSSILVNDINLEVNPHGLVTSVWGFCPYMNWIASVLEPPQAEIGEIRFVGASPIKRGVSTRLGRERWPVFADKSSGWLHLVGTATGARAVAIMTGVIIELDERRNICGIWLKPAKLPEFS